MARGLEGLRRQDGIHAAAVVITKEPLTEYLPIQRKPEAGQDPELAPVVTQYEMHGVEDLGLLKMDFLGLRNLDVIADTVELIAGRTGHRPRHRRHPARRRRRPTSCCRPATRSACSSSRAGHAGPDALAGARPLRGRRRPGGALPARARWPPTCTTTTPTARTAASRSTTSTPTAEELLGDTYGLMIYQEVVMRVAQKFAGYSLAEADNLRKACGKKIRELMAKEREKFVAGCEATGYGARAGHRAVRHHRAVRRLRLQQEPQLRLRPGGLPDRLPQGQLPGRVLRRPAHQRQDQPGQGGGLPQRVPPDGHRGAGPRPQRVGQRLRRRARRRQRARRAGSHPVRPVGGAQRGRGPGRRSSSPSARPTGPSSTSTTSATGSTSACSTSGPSSR